MAGWPSVVGLVRLEPCLEPVQVARALVIRRFWSSLHIFLTVEYLGRSIRQIIDAVVLAILGGR